ncbi:MAG TPA: TonB-dependent receptor [Steroidobacteraceae bacterium]|jgi:iron complex outermembrane receptor protein|nr:TonB-dependent receptor [Steroidobacteraceae bacterium]
MAKSTVHANSFSVCASLVIAAATCVLAVFDAHAQAVSNTAADTGPLAEVVVTAERRSTDLQVTPVAASVLSGADLQSRGVNTVDQLQFTTPSLTVNDFGQGIMFNIRGIGKGESNVQTPAGVITYRDGIPVIATFLQNEPYYDIASIEVLRGPQGTFSGVNATGGAVYITEANPNFNGVSGYGQLQYGNYNDRLWQGAINLPIGETFAARIAYNGERRQTYFNLHGPYTGDPGIIDSNNVRVSLLWRPSDALKILVKTDYNNINNGGYPGQPYTIPGSLYDINTDVNAYAFDEFTRSVVDISYTFANGNVLRSVSGYQHARAAQNVDLDGTNRAFPTSSTFSDYGRFEAYSEELNFLSPDTGFFRWIAGAFFSHEVEDLPFGNGFNINVDLTTPYPAPLLPLVNINLEYNTPKKHEGVFGQVKFEFSPQWELQVGARYNHSTFDLTDNQTTNLLFPPPPLAIPLPNSQSQSDSKLTGKVDLSYKLTPDNYLFAFVATGHKDGGLNTNANEPAVIQPENLTDYEVGWKSMFLDRHVRTQTGAFYTTYKDFQVSLPDPATGTAPILNAPHATVWGFELQAQAELSDLSVDASASYIHGRFGDFYAIDSRLYAAPYPPCNLSYGPATAECSNLTGHTLPNSPTWTANAGIQYTYHVAANQTFTPRLDYAFVASQWATVFANSSFADSLDSRTLFNVLLSYDIGKLDIAAFATNFTNRQYVAAQSVGTPVPVQLIPGVPRLYGIRAMLRF